MQIKKSQRRDRKAGRKACRSRKSCRKARRSMHGGAVVTVYNKLPPTEAIKILHKSPVVNILHTLIDYLEQNVGVADVFAQGRGMTRVQLITDLLKGELVLHPINYDRIYVIIRVTDPRPPFPSPPPFPEDVPPLLVPAYVPPPSSRSDL